MAESYLDILAGIIRNNWDQPALTDFYLTEDGTAPDASRGNHYTYGEMYMEIVRVAKLLIILGLQKGDHIAICGANSAHWVIAYLAVARMQGVSVTVMHSLMPDQIANLVDFSDAKALFVDDELWMEISKQPLPQLKSVIALGDWNCLMGRLTGTIEEPADNRIVAFPQSHADDLSMICFTSGTTERPKGVMLSSGCLSNNVSNGMDAYPIDANPDFLCVLPMFHMYGLMIEILSQIVRGKHIWIMNNHPNIANIWRGILCVRPYAMAVIPAIMEALCAKYTIHENSAVKNFCKQIHVGGASFSHTLTQEIREHGLPVSIGYGLTETGPLISDSQSHEYRLLSCGRVVTGMEVRIASNGEILAKGKNVMLGYYKDPKATAKKIDADGWLHTGDRGHLDEDGYLYVEGRLEQDMIVLPNGENIRPDNIEALINALPEVKESIVLARDGKLVGIVVVSDQFSAISNQTEIRRNILRTINPQLPLFSQLYDVEITDIQLQRTEKQTLKRYLYK